MFAPRATRHTSIRYSSSCHTHASTSVHRYSSLLPCLQVSEVTWHWWDEYFARNARCTVTTDLLVWYSNTQNDFYPRAAIFSLHTLASLSGRNVNYDEKQLTGGKKKLSCSLYLYRFRKYVSYSFPIINCCNPRVHYETLCILYKFYIDWPTKGLAHLFVIVIWFQTVGWLTSAAVTESLGNLRCN